MHLADCLLALIDTMAQRGDLHPQALDDARLLDAAERIARHRERVESLLAAQGNRVKVVGVAHADMVDQHVGDCSRHAQAHSRELRTNPRDVASVVTIDAGRVRRCRRARNRQGDVLCAQEKERREARQPAAAKCHHFRNYRRNVRRRGAAVAAAEENCARDTFHRFSAGCVQLGLQANEARATIQESDI